MSHQVPVAQNKYGIGCIYQTLPPRPLTSVCKKWRGGSGLASKTMMEAQYVYLGERLATIYPVAEDRLRAHLGPVRRLLHVIRRSFSRLRLSQKSLHSIRLTNAKLHILQHLDHYTEDPPNLLHCTMCCNPNTIDRMPWTVRHSREGCQRRASQQRRLPKAGFSALKQCRQDKNMHN